MTSLAAVLTVAAVLLAPSPSAARRLEALDVAQGAQPGGGARARARPAWLTTPWVAGVLAAFAVVLVVGGVAGVVLGASAGVVVALWVARLEPTAARRRRQQELADLPLALDLIVAAAEAGRPPAYVVTLVAEAVGGPLGERFAGIVVQLELGADPVEVWRAVADDPVLAPVGRAFARAARSGSSLGRSLVRSADDLRASQHAEAQERARSVGVRTAAPLGACFLPAFLLLGVVPTVAATFTSLNL